MKIKTLFYANKPSGYIKNLLDSLAKQDNINNNGNGRNFNTKLKSYDYSFIGHNDNFIGFGNKLVAIRDYVNYYLDSSYSHVLVLDAYDLIILQDQIVFMNKYNDYFKRNQIVFSAEVNCYPNKTLEVVYPKEDEYFRFLNAGSWIAPIDEINNLIPKKIHLKIHDQEYFSRLFINEQHNIVLDYDCRLFQTLYNVKKDILDIDEKGLHNTLSDSYPCILHGNGKVDMLPYINKLKIKI